MQSCKFLSFLNRNFFPDSFPASKLKKIKDKNKTENITKVTKVFFCMMNCFITYLEISIQKSGMKIFVKMNKNFGTIIRLFLAY